MADDEDFDKKFDEMEKKIEEGLEKAQNDDFENSVERRARDIGGGSRENYRDSSDMMKGSRGDAAYVEDIERLSKAELGAMTDSELKQAEAELDRIAQAGDTEDPSTRNRASVERSRVRQALEGKFDDLSQPEPGAQAKGERTAKRMERGNRSAEVTQAKDGKWDGGYGDATSDQVREQDHERARRKRAAQEGDGKWKDTDWQGAEPDEDAKALQNQRKQQRLNQESAKNETGRWKDTDFQNAPMDDEALELERQRQRGAVSKADAAMGKGYRRARNSKIGDGVVSLADFLFSIKGLGVIAGLILTFLLFIYVAEAVLVVAATIGLWGFYAGFNADSYSMFHDVEALIIAIIFTLSAFNSTLSVLAGQFLELETIAYGFTAIGTGVYLFVGDHYKNVEDALSWFEPHGHSTPIFILALQILMIMFVLSGGAMGIPFLTGAGVFEALAIMVGLLSPLTVFIVFHPEGAGGRAVRGAGRRARPHARRASLETARYRKKASRHASRIGGKIKQGARRVQQARQGGGAQGGGPEQGAADGDDQYVDLDDDQYRWEDEERREGGE